MVASHASHIVNALVGTRKTPPAQLEVMPTASASKIFALIDDRKNTTSASCLGQDRLGH